MLTETFSAALDQDKSGSRINLPEGLQLASFENLPSDRLVRTRPDTDAPTEISWRRNVLDAYHEARDGRKPLFVLFADDSCPYCKRLASEALQDPRLIARANDAVFLIANPEKDSNSAQMANSLKISGYPTVAVLSAETGAINEIGRVVGYMPPDEFMRQIAALLPTTSGPDNTQNSMVASTKQDTLLDFGTAASLYGAAAATVGSRTIAA